MCIFHKPTSTLLIFKPTGLSGGEYTERFYMWEHWHGTWSYSWEFFKLFSQQTPTNFPCQALQSIWKALSLASNKAREVSSGTKNTIMSSIWIAKSFRVKKNLSLSSEMFALLPDNLVFHKTKSYCSIHIIKIQKAPIFPNTQGAHFDFVHPKTFAASDPCPQGIMHLWWKMVHPFSHQQNQIYH